MKYKKYPSGFFFEEIKRKRLFMIITHKVVIVICVSQVYCMISFCK